MKAAIRAGMVYLTEEIIDTVEQQHERLVDKDDSRQVIEMMHARFEAQQKMMDERFEAVNVRFEVLHRKMNTRFEALEKQFKFIQWFLGGGMLGGLLLVTLKLFFPHIFSY